MAKMTVKLGYPPEMTHKPVISQLVRDFNITFSIMRAEVVPDQRGRLTLALEGEEDDLRHGLDYLRAQDISVRVLTRTVIWNSEKCVACGACTGVCASGALRLDAEANLKFDPALCTACELCLKSCPLSAMDVDLFSAPSPQLSHPAQ